MNNDFLSSLRTLLAGSGRPGSSNTPLPFGPGMPNQPPEITYNPNQNTNIPYSAHSMQMAQLGNQYTANPTAPRFLGVDPAKFGYPADNTGRGPSMPWQDQVPVGQPLTPQSMSRLPANVQPLAQIYNQNPMDPRVAHMDPAMFGYQPDSTAQPSMMQIPKITGGGAVGGVAGFAQRLNRK